MFETILYLNSKLSAASPTRQLLLFIETLAPIPIQLLPSIRSTPRVKQTCQPIPPFQQFEAPSIM